MNIHKNARLTPHGRERMVRAIVEAGRRRRPPHEPQASARARRANGLTASRPKAWPDCRTAPRGRIGCAGRRPAVVDQVIALRRQRWPASRSPAAGVSPATVSRVLKRAGPEPAEGPGAGRAGPPLRARASRRADPHRHQEARPLRPGRPPHHRRPQGAEQRTVPGRRRLGVRPCLHRRCLARRLHQIMPNEKAKSAIAFLKAAVAYYNSLGVTVAGVMTDNGSCYKAFAFDAPAKGSSSSTSAPGPTRPRPTARPSASSRPRCANGPMPSPTTPQTNAPNSSSRGSTLQLASPAWQPKSPHTHQPPRPLRGQPVEAPQLEHDPEKWEPVFGKDHARTDRESGMMDSKKNHPALCLAAGLDPA